MRLIYIQIAVYNMVTLNQNIKFMIDLWLRKVKRSNNQVKIDKLDSQMT